MYYSQSQNQNRENQASCLRSKPIATQNFLSENSIPDRIILHLFFGALELTAAQYRILHLPFEARNPLEICGSPGGLETQVAAALRAYGYLRRGMQWMRGRGQEIKENAGAGESEDRRDNELPESRFI